MYADKKWRQCILVFKNLFWIFERMEKKKNEFANENTNENKFPWENEIKNKHIIEQKNEMPDKPNKRIWNIYELIRFFLCFFFILFSHFTYENIQSSMATKHRCENVV